jgi:hypothetical protein
MAEQKQKVSVVLFAGRVNDWQQSIDNIQKYILEPLSKRGPVLVFASVHKYSDGSNARDVDAFLERIRPLLHHTHHYLPAEPDHAVFSSFYPGCPNAPKRYASMFYHLNKAFKLLQFHLWKNPQVDPHVVIKLRPDFNPLEAWDWLPAEPAENTIYYPRSSRYYSVLYSEPVPPPWIPDHAGVGTLQSMEKYCSIYSYLYLQLKETYGLVLITPEFVLHQYLVAQFGMKVDGTHACEYEIDSHSLRRKDVF